MVETGELAPGQKCHCVSHVQMHLHRWTQPPLPSLYPLKDKHRYTQFIKRIAIKNLHRKRA
jgi:hypothetical protein